MKVYVLGFMFFQKYRDLMKVALIRKEKPEWQKGLLNGIGGSIEPGETPHGAMVREFAEETGGATSIHDWDLFLTMTFKTKDGGDSAIVYVFRSFPKAAPILDSKTSEKVLWCNADNVRNWKAIDNLKWIIPMALDPNANKAEVRE